MRGSRARGLVNLLEGAIIQCRAAGREHGVALLTEGLLGKLDPENVFSGVTYNSFGQVRLEALALSRVLEPAVSASLSRGPLPGAIAPRGWGRASQRAAG